MLCCATLKFLLVQLIATKRFSLGWRRSGFLRPGVFLALGLPILAQGQNSVQWTTNYYSITGATLAEIRQSLNQAKGENEKNTVDGLTAWQIDWRYKVTPTASGCRCSAFTTQMAITITLPRWLLPGNAGQDVKNAWTRYFTTLLRHEDGHVQNALRMAAQMQQSVAVIGEDRDCDGLKKKIGARIQQIVAEHRKWDKEYDERTHHGMLQGVSFP